MNLFTGLLSLLLVSAHAFSSLIFHFLGLPLAFVSFAKPAIALTHRPLKIDTHHHFLPDFYVKGKCRSPI